METLLPKVLIIEDDDSLLNMYRYKLEMEGFVVYTSKTGENVMSMIHQFEPEIILIDIMMPIVNGFEALEVITHEITYPAKKIIFSNLNRPGDMEYAKKLGADDYYIKSNLMPKELVAKLRLLLTQ